jgi:gliding motility-associated-like protein
MITKKKFYALLITTFAILFIQGSALRAQLQVNTAVTANQLVQSLIGSGITVSNVQLNCPAGAFGTFSNGNTTNLGINSGIILTSGTAAVGGPATGSASQCWGTTANDPDLIAIDPTANNDVCILEFDIVPQCDSLEIRFVFGSEEYPTFVNSINDLFGFFVTGPNPAGGNYTSLNIATLPVAGNPPVSINTVNNGNANAGPCTNCQFYVNNTGGPWIMYDGMTTAITSRLWMVPCQSYHFKIAIADAADCILDSGVLIDFLTCSSAFTFTTADQPDVCNSCTGSATVNMSGGIPPYTYQWLPSGGNGPTASNLCAGTYSVLVTDQASCGVPDTIVFNIANNGSIAAQSQQTDATCFGDCNGSITVTPQGGNPPFTYTWSPNVGNTATVNGLCVGTYTVDVADATGCTSQYTYTITQPTQLTGTITGNNTICAGDQTTITATPAGGTGPYTVSWDNSLPNGLTQTVSPTATTVYTATFTDANGCNIQQSFTVTIAPAPVAAVDPIEGNCAPATVVFTDASTGATSWQWDFGDVGSPSNTSTQQNPSHVYLSAGTYNVTLIVSNAGGCSDTLVITNAVTISPDPVAGVTVNTSVVSELSPEVVFTDLSNGGTDCILYFGDGDSLVGCNFGNITHSYPSAGIYTATMIVTNADGCADTITITVIVEEETTLYVPNAFTPNASGVNDQFFAYGTKVNEFELLVFDRWGMLIFQSNDINKGWDGTLKGNPCQQDVYVWKITYNDQRNKRHRMIGHVSLIR